MYKNGRPARVVMTDAGLNDYINDFLFCSLVGGRRERDKSPLEGSGEISLRRKSPTFLYLVFARVFLSSGFRGVATGLFRVGWFLGIIIPVILPLFGRCLLRLTLSVSVTEISRNMVQ